MCEIASLSQATQLLLMFSKITGVFVQVWQVCAAPDSGTSTRAAERKFVMTTKDWARCRSAGAAVAGTQHGECGQALAAPCQMLQHQHVDIRMCSRSAIQMPLPRSDSERTVRPRVRIQAVRLQDWHCSLLHASRHLPGHRQLLSAIRALCILKCLHRVLSGLRHGGIYGHRGSRPGRARATLVYS